MCTLGPEVPAHNLVALGEVIQTVDSNRVPENHMERGTQEVICKHAPQHSA
jgi:hypothetical protein